MGFIELLLIAVGLSMDAFAVSICKGLSVQKVKPKHAACVSLYFGGFQALMPLIGYFLGSSLKSLIEAYDHWIAFVLLALIGANMIREAFSEEETQNDSFSFRTMFMMAIATSIDALAVGVTFAFLDVNLLFAVLFIGVTTFALSAAGVRIGNVFGVRYKARAELAGGIILILLGCKILAEHMGWLTFCTQPALAPRTDPPQRPYRPLRGFLYTAGQEPPSLAHKRG